jgi:hypothetical protein
VKAYITLIGNAEKKDLMEDLGLDEGIILKWTLGE